MRLAFSFLAVVCAGWLDWLPTYPPLGMSAILAYFIDPFHKQGLISVLAALATFRLLLRKATYPPPGYFPGTEQK